MRRRTIVGLIGSTVVLPHAVRAQPANAPVVGFLSSRSAEESAGKANLLGFPDAKSYPTPKSNAQLISEDLSQAV